jgi:uncharacterized protein
MYRLDHAYERLHNIAGLTLPIPPSQYVKRVFATFQHEPTNSTREILGADNLLWSSDYPHTDCFWPNDRELIRNLLKGVPQTEMARLVGGNAATLYKLQ